MKEGLEAGLGGGFLRPATKELIGGAGGESVFGGGGGGTAPGGGGTGVLGGLRAGAAGRVASPSDIYGESRPAPVSIPPPRLRNLGIPPAKSPPN